MRLDQDTDATGTENEGDNMMHRKIATLRGKPDQTYSAAMSAIRNALFDVEHGRRGNLGLRDQEFMSWVDRRMMEIVATHPSCPEAFETSEGRSRVFSVHHLSGPTTEARTSLHLSVRAYTARTPDHESAIDLTVEARRHARGVRFERRIDTLADETYDRPDGHAYKRQGDDDWCERFLDGTPRTREDGRPATIRNYCVDQQEVEAGTRSVSITRVRTHAQDLHDRFSNLDL